MIKILVLAALCGLTIGTVVDNGDSYTVTQPDGSTAWVLKSEAIPAYRDVREWLRTHALASPAPTPVPKYEAPEAVRLQLEILAISTEMSQNTSAPAGLADLKAATLRRLNYIRTLQPAPVSVPESLSTTR